MSSAHIVETIFGLQESNGCGTPVPFDEQAANEPDEPNEPMNVILAKVSNRLRADAPSFNSVTRALTRRLCEFLLPFENTFILRACPSRHLSLMGLQPYGPCDQDWLNCIFVQGYAMGSWTGIAEPLNCRASVWVAASTAQMNFNMLCQIWHVKHIKTHISQVVPIFSGSVRWVKSQAKPAPIAFSWMLLGQVGHYASF